ncbi:F0F1 ATP synthase subunit delta [Herbiconiux moechotypicola]|uniref:ATP synthase subunit delta n=1 Tax=Herbiconiux moechotypicola TaxID=637393 RepID=A0ABN3D7H8_9MICO|nr:F0F1 ATP synthase subunit delta [Herbiconiux moechotypicola]MCS5728435.1 F0F1 ATP synthase subunit delta [Herbiconiux moechotypicola]
MGSATRVALGAAKDRLAVLGSGADLATGEELFAAGRIIGDSSHLLGALSDPGAEPVAKTALVSKLFGPVLGSSAVGLLEGIASSRWSSQSDLLAGIEEIGIRAVASSAPKSASVDAELFEFSRAVASDAELELALGSKLGSVDQKRALVERLIGGKASAQTVAVVLALVTQPRGRRIGELLRFASSVVADQAGASVATVVSASALSAAQSKRLGAVLQTQYGRPVLINQVIDPAVVGGVRIQLGDDVIDGSVSTRLNDLRLQLAG